MQFVKLFHFKTVDDIIKAEDYTRRHEKQGGKVNVQWLRGPNCRVIVSYPFPKELVV